MVLISCFTSFLERNSDQISESSFRFGKQSETRAHIILILIPTHTLIVHNPHTGAKTLIKKHKNNLCSVVKSCRGRTVMGYVFTFACRWDSWMLCKPVATGSSVSLDKTLLLPINWCAEGGIHGILLGTKHFLHLYWLRNLHCCFRHRGNVNNINLRFIWNLRHGIFVTKIKLGKMYCPWV